MGDFAGTPSFLKRSAASAKPSFSREDYMVQFDGKEVPVPYEGHIQGPHAGNIVALVSYWNEADRLPLLIASLAGCVNAAVFLDGAYAGMTDPGAGSSSDGSGRVIDEVSKEVGLMSYRCGALGLNEMEKRSTLFRLIQDGVWGLVIDADEILVAPPMDWTRRLLSQVESSNPAIRVPFYEIGRPRDWRARLIRKTPGMRYEGTHYRIVDDWGPVDTDSAPAPDLDLRVLHVPRTRLDATYEAQRARYDRDVRPSVEKTG